MNGARGLRKQPRDAFGTMVAMVSDASLSDESIILQAQSASDAARRQRLLDELFERYRRRVAVWCLRMTGNRESAADLAQEIFLKAFAGLDRFAGRARFSTWLYSITRNHCLNHLAQRSRRPQHEVVEELDESLPDEQGLAPFDALESESSRRLLRQVMMEQLSPEERQAMTLHFVEDVPLATITRMLALRNKSGAKALIVSSKRKLRRALLRLQAAGRMEIP